MKKIFKAASMITSLLAFTFTGITQEVKPAGLNKCHGEHRPLEIVRNMPYTLVKVNGSEGMYLVDFASSYTTIDTSAFNGRAPRPAEGTINSFPGFDFFSSWGPVTLTHQDHSNITGIRQAGILGVDFLSLNTFTLDYAGKKLYRSKKNECHDSIYRREGFVPVSTEGYYNIDQSRLKPGVYNVPTVPVTIGGVSGVAQIDPGFDDSNVRHSVNINKAYFDSLQARGIALVRVPSMDLTLSTCIQGISEQVEAYRPQNPVHFQVIGTNGNPVISVIDPVYFLKNPSTQIRSGCGGIAKYDFPAAQFGASFLMDAKRIIFDPFNSLVWFPVHPGGLREQQKQ